MDEEKQIPKLKMYKIAGLGEEVEGHVREDE